LVATANAAAQIEVFLKVGNGGFGAGRVALGASRIAPVVVGIGIIGLEADRFGVILQGAIEVALVGARIAPVAVGVGIIGLEADRKSVV